MTIVNITLKNDAFIAFAIFFFSANFNATFEIVIAFASYLSSLRTADRLLVFGLLNLVGYRVHIVVGLWVYRKWQLAFSKIFRHFRPWEWELGGMTLEERPEVGASNGWRQNGK